VSWAEQEPVDLAKLARRRRRAAHRHNWLLGKRGMESCASCPETFPCRQPCSHVDCIIRRAEIGLRVDVDFGDLPAGIKVTNPETGKIEFDTTDDDPVEWVVPGG
jgi:hypothetical protein